MPNVVTEIPARLHSVASDHIVAGANEIYDDNLGKRQSEINSNLGTGSSKNVPSSGDAGANELVLGNDSRLTDSRNAKDVHDWAKASTKPTYNKSEVGLENVTNDAQVKRSEMGAASGVATLNENGKVPSSQLPSYVDDAIELIAMKATAPSTCVTGDQYYNTSSAKIFTATATNTWSATGETPEKGKIYINLNNDRTYRWGGSAMVPIKGDLTIGTGAGDAADGKVVDDHIKNTNNPHSVTKSQVGLGNVGNFKAVSTVASQGLSDTEKSNARANIGAGTSSFSGNYNDLSNKPSSMPASDVSAWAKASTKPSYNLDEVSDGNTRKLADKIGKTIKTTWANLKSLRDNSQLIPGQWYRITDYVTKVYHYDSNIYTQDVRSAEHQFDVIVFADSVNRLNEHAHAAIHEDDTYFNDVALSRWQLWYCIDNSRTLINNIQASDGKGVIYRMIDENNNDLPYDFKNVQWLRLPMTGSCFSTFGNDYVDIMGNYISTDKGSLMTYSKYGDYIPEAVICESYDYDGELSSDGTRTFMNMCSEGDTGYDAIIEVNYDDGEWFYTFDGGNGTAQHVDLSTYFNSIFNNRFIKVYDSIFSICNNSHVDSIFCFTGSILQSNVHIDYTWGYIYDCDVRYVSNSVISAYRSVIRDVWFCAGSVSKSDVYDLYFSNYYLENSKLNIPIYNSNVNLNNIIMYGSKNCDTNWNTRLLNDLSDDFKLGTVDDYNQIVIKHLTQL